MRAGGGDKPVKVVILAGGLGTRLQEETVIRPKPMVEIGGRPMIWHIMKIYAAHGHKEFLVALGYKGEVIKSYFLNYYYLRNSFSIQLSDGKIDVHEGNREQWDVHLIDTGLETQTGGRMRRLGPFLQNETFMLTYGDGVGSVDIRELERFHRKHGKLATVTAVRPPARFGGISLNGNAVAKFREKHQIDEGWINGGFFVLEPEVLDYIDGDDSAFEREPLERLADDGQLVAYQHNGFWQSMDTLRDVDRLQRLWRDEEAHWKVWER